MAEAAITTFINGVGLTVQKRSRVLNHYDRISFAGCIYVFKYPKLRRALNQLKEASAELNTETSQITEKEQNELAW